MQLAENGRSLLEVMTCTNVGQPLVWIVGRCPTADVIWLARPIENVRRVFYYGYHTRIRATIPKLLPIDACWKIHREHPVILCYKLNDRG